GGCSAARLAVSDAPGRSRFTAGPRGTPRDPAGSDEERMPVAGLSPLDVSLAAAAGVAIAAACGLRAFLPLLALSLGVHFELIHVHPGAAWIGSLPAILTLVWATVLELAADKVPALDHALDVVALGLRPAAAALAAWA